MSATVTQLRTPTSERAALFARMRKNRASIEQYFLDVEHWNHIDPNELMEADPDGEMRRIMSAYDRSLAIEEERIKRSRTTT